MWSTFSIRYNRKKTQELDTSLIASIPKSLLRTLRTFAQQEATRGLVLCQMTALLVLDPAPAAKLEGKSGGQAGQQWVLTQSLPQSFLVYSISNAIQYIEFVYMYHIYIHNNTIPYYPILSHTISLYHYFLAHHWKPAGGPHLFALPLPSWKVRRIASSQGCHQLRRYGKPQTKMSDTIIQ